ncbi:MAG: F0F1 ATP synthase subunit epsilon [Defluviitaleaceae bacterium]|nr:F0F1 ATP synthase subunit epsilon [Defluviitaleaceae bacterium]
MKQFKLSVITPDGEILNTSAERIIFRTTQGDMAVMSGHAPFTCVLVPCKIKIKAGEHIIFVEIESGFAEISQEKVMVMTDNAFIVKEE